MNANTVAAADAAAAVASAKHSERQQPTHDNPNGRQDKEFHFLRVFSVCNSKYLYIYIFVLQQQQQPKGQKQQR